MASDPAYGPSHVLERRQGSLVDPDPQQRPRVGGAVVTIGRPECAPKDHVPPAPGACEQTNGSPERDLEAGGGSRRRPGRSCRRRTLPVAVKKRDSLAVLPSDVPRSWQSLGSTPISAVTIRHEAWGRVAARPRLSSRDATGGGASRAANVGPWRLKQRATVGSSQARAAQSGFYCRSANHPGLGVGCGSRSHRAKAQRAGAELRRPSIRRSPRRERPRVRAGADMAASAASGSRHAGGAGALTVGGSASRPCSRCRASR